MKIKILGKAVPLFALVLALSGTAFAAALVVINLPSTITINEAFSTTTTDASFDGFTGGQYCKTIPVANAANVDITAEVTFNEDTNPNLVVYTTNNGSHVTIPAGSSADVDSCIDVDTNSPAGVVSGTVTIARV